MSAESTAQRVLAWAAAPAGPGRTGQPPTGALWDFARLAAPERTTLALAGRLARSAAARLGAGLPPFGDQDKVGLGPVLLAAAVGGRGQPQDAQRLALAAPASRPARDRPDEARWYDLVARHGVAAPALPSLTAARAAETRARGPRAGRSRAGDPPAREAGSGDASEPLAETLLLASPLTAVLYRPPLRRLATQTTGDAVEAAAALIKRPRGQAVLSAALSRWDPDIAVLNWRTELLERLGGDHPELVLDTYTQARLRSAADWDRRLNWARRALSTSGPADRLAIATIRFWAPLLRLRQRGVSLGDARPLLTGYRPAMQLVTYHQLLATGPA